MSVFLLCFVPLFVAVDPLGILPLFMGLTQGMELKDKRRVTLQSVFTAMVVAVLFVFGGPWLLRLLGLTIGDFMVAGGLLLLTMSITDILSTDKARRKAEPSEVGAVPIGVPIVAGPALFTTSLLLEGQYGLWPTLSAIVCNIAIVGIVFWLSEPIYKVLGRNGAKTISKLASLLLAAISVMIIRRGIMSYLEMGLGS